MYNAAESIVGTVQSYIFSHWHHCYILTTLEKEIVRAIFAGCYLRIHPYSCMPIQLWPRELLLPNAKLFKSNYIRGVTPLACLCSVWIFTAPYTNLDLCPPLLPRGHMPRYIILTKPLNIAGHRKQQVYAPHINAIDNLNNKASTRYSSSF